MPDAARSCELWERVDAPEAEFQWAVWMDDGSLSGHVFWFSDEAEAREHLARIGGTA